MAGLPIVGGISCRERKRTGNNDEDDEDDAGPEVDYRLCTSLHYTRASG